MAYYRLYFVQGSSIRGVEEIDAPDDESAMAAARAHMGQAGLELWQESRKVGRIEPNEPGVQLLADRNAGRSSMNGAAQEHPSTI